MYGWSVDDQLRVLLNCPQGVQTDHGLLIDDDHSNVVNPFGDNVDDSDVAVSIEEVIFCDCSCILFCVKQSCCSTSSLTK